LPKFEDIETPLLSAANWGGMGLHPRGNFEGFLRAGSKQKWLEVHGDTHFTLFYAKYGQDLQRKFFDRFLKGIDNGWEKRPKVLLQVRHPGEKFVERAEKRMAARPHAMDQALPASRPRAGSGAGGGRRKR